MSSFNITYKGYVPNVNTDLQSALYGNYIEAHFREFLVRVDEKLVIHKTFSLQSVLIG